MDKLREYLNLIAPFGLGGAAGILLVLSLLSNPGILLKIWRILAKLLYDVFGIWKKKAQAAQIEGHINAAIQQLGNESPAAFSSTLKLEWISDAEDYAKLDEGTVVVRVRNDPNLTKPLVAATMLYLETGVIPDSRPYVERRLLQAIDLALAYRILENSPQRDAVNYLTAHYLEPSTIDPRIAHFYETADIVDRAGILTRIVLRELSGYAAKLVGKRPTAVIRSESVNFFEFAARVIRRTTEVPLTFFGRYLRCTVALIARPETYQRSGLALYQRNFQRDIDLGVNVIYLLSRGPRNLQVARLLAKWATEERLISGSIPDRYLQPDEFGELIPAECIVCFSARVGRSIQVGPLEEALIAISQFVPESLTGQVEVVSIAREPGKVTKILVHSDSVSDPLAICTGHDRSRLRSITEHLGIGERVDFILWSPDIRKNVVSALIPLQHDDVVSVWVSPDSLAVKVIVRSTESAHRAVGTNGVNLAVSRRLLNTHINIETRETPLSPEDELIQALFQHIPEVYQGRIEIVKVARRVGKAAKIAIRSPDIRDPRKVCIGPGGNISHLISNDLGGEQLTFVIWDPQNPEGVLRQALFPLRESEIVSLSIDKNQRTAVVTVKKGGPIAIAIGKQGDNVRLAERICDLCRIEILEAQSKVSSP